MSKKNRILKKHYRNIERELREFDLDLSEDSWYNLWHMHLDWDGITAHSQKQRKEHILYYMKFLDKIENLTKDSKVLYQTWIFVSGHQGIYDAIYFHTQNPHTEFPYELEDIEWEADIPKLLRETLNLSKFMVGKIKGENEDFYYIQKAGVGQEIKRR